MDGHTLLIVDDEPANLSILAQLLRPEFKVRAANSGRDALLAVAAEPKPDLVLLDVMMPEMDGYDVLAAMRGNPDTSDIPVIFLTALGEAEQEERGLASGAADYIAKPIKPAVLQARVRNQLHAKRQRDELREQGQNLRREIARRIAENDSSQQLGMRALAHLAETRDPETGAHILRTQGYVRLLAQRLQRHPRFKAVLSDRYIDLLARSAPLHDIGKVGIPDHILLKPGELNEEEWAVMRTHARLGSEAIERAEHDIGRNPEFLSVAKEIAHWHHEKWDGSGYPDGLCGEEIPLSARLMAIADVFDALISKRVYKPAMSHEDARAIIAQGRGIHFDPDICDEFLRGFADMEKIADRFKDED
ncbi:MAG TPA: two-component system response regulator [Burkholderiaceae bacterium]